MADGDVERRREEGASLEWFRVLGGQDLALGFPLWDGILYVPEYE